MIFQTQPSTGSRSAQQRKAAWLYLVVFAGVSQQVPEEVEAGALAHQDEVGGAVGQVGGGREAFGAAGASAAHAGRVDGQELPPDCPPLAVALYKGETHTHTHQAAVHMFSATAPCWLKGLLQSLEAERAHLRPTPRPPRTARPSLGGAARCDDKPHSWRFTGRKGCEWSAS